MQPLSKATENFRKVLELANWAAAEMGTSFVGSEHFIYAFFNLPECEACKILLSVGVSKEKYQTIFRERVDKTFSGDGLTLRTKKMYDAAVYMAEEDGLKASTAHMLYQILLSPSCCAVQFLKEIVLLK